MSEKPMTLKRAIIEVVQENPVLIGMFFSVLGRMLDIYYQVFPSFTLLGFMAGYGLYYLTTDGVG